jgi:hypothetical protein
LILNRESILILKLYQQSRGKQRSQLQDIIDTTGTTTRYSKDLAISVNPGGADDVQQHEMTVQRGAMNL